MVFLVVYVVVPASFYWYLLNTLLPNLTTANFKTFKSQTS